MYYIKWIAIFSLSKRCCGGSSGGILCVMVFTAWNLWNNVPISTEQKLKLMTLRDSLRGWSFFLSLSSFHDNNRVKHIINCITHLFLFWYNRITREKECLSCKAAKCIGNKTTLFIAVSSKQNVHLQQCIVSLLYNNNKVIIIWRSEVII